MSNVIDWLVFDLGGVLVDVASQQQMLARWSELSGSTPSRLASVLRERFVDGADSLAERLQVGEMDARGFHELLTRELAGTWSIDETTAALQSMLLGENPDVLALLARWATSHRIACYSNTNIVHWQHMRARYRLFDHVDRAFASHEIGFAKPDRRGFDSVAAALGAAPARCLLIDDLQINVEGARQAGWQAVRFIDAAKLETDLSSFVFDAAVVAS